MLLVNSVEGADGQNQPQKRIKVFVLKIIMFIFYVIIIVNSRYEKDGGQASIDNQSQEKDDGIYSFSLLL